jgi:hypothetical protein
MVNSTATAGNLIKGGARFLHNFGSISNTFLGYNAGNLSMTGGLNTAAGSQTLQSNTTGCCNTASGANALISNNTGSANTAMGEGSLYTNSTGNNNTAIGRYALISNTTGSANTATGSNALQNNTTGFDNTAVGTEALFSNIGGGVPGLPTGISNTAVGRSALRANTTGKDNTAVGTEALFSNTTDGLLAGWENTAVGRSALRANTTGVGNIASGFFALLSNTTGNYNTASGRNALQNNTTGGGNTASGLVALVNNTTGNNNTASGSGALETNTTGVRNTAIGAGADVTSGNLTNATAIGAGATVGFSNRIRLGNFDVTVVETSGVVKATGFNGTCASGFGGVFYPVICNQDLAETFRTLEATEPGDLVVLVTQPGTIPTVRKSARAYEGLLLGAVATNPGLVFDNGETHLAGDNSKLITSEKTAVGLVGRVPVKVSLENGPIAVGDPITSSSSAGVGMKATSAGQIIGYALEKADQKGKVLVHLQPGYYIPSKLLAALNQQDFVAGLNAQQAEVEELKSQLSKLESLLQTVLVQHSEKSASVTADR